MEKIAGLTAENIQTFGEAVKKAAVTNNPTLSQTALAGQKAQKAVEEVSAGYLPSITAGYSHTLNAGAGQSLDAGYGSLSVSASIPLDFWKTAASVEAKKVAAKQTDLDGEESLRSLVLDIQGGIYNCISSARSVISSKKALEYSENNYRSVFELYKLSSASSSDLMDAEALVSTNRAALINARYSFLEYLSALRSLSGDESESLLTSRIP
jgi:outer membrane protein